MKEQRALKDKLKQSEQPKEKVMQGSNKIVKRKNIKSGLIKGIDMKKEKNRISIPYKQNGKA